MSKGSAVILDFWKSQSSVATQVRWDRRPCNFYIESFLGNLAVKEFWKSVCIYRSYDQKSSVLFFETVYIELRVRLHTAGEVWDVRLSCRQWNCVNKQGVCGRDSRTIWGLSGEMFWANYCVWICDMQRLQRLTSRCQRYRRHDNTRVRLGWVGMCQVWSDFFTFSWVG